MRVFYSASHREHNPPFEIYDGGEKITSFEVPERVERILAALQTTGWAEIAAPQDFGVEPVRAVHDGEYLDFLEHAFGEWTAIKEGYAKIALLPATFPPAGWRRKPRSLLGRAGYYTNERALKELGNRQAANMVLLGAVVKTVGMVSQEALLQSLSKRVPSSFLETNKKALTLGFELAKGR